MYTFHVYLPRLLFMCIWNIHVHTWGYLMYILFTHFVYLFLVFFSCIDVHICAIYMYTCWYPFHKHLPRLLFMCSCTYIWDIHVHMLVPISYISSSSSFHVQMYLYKYTCTHVGNRFIYIFLVYFSCIDIHIYEIYMYTRWYTLRIHLPRLLFMCRCTYIWNIHVHMLGRRDIQLFTTSMLLKIRYLFCRI